jgi:cell fate regulator YaaT (PSP1 superfamily)
MTLEAGIVFDYINEIHYTKVPEDMNLKINDQLIVKTVRSKEVGKVAHLRETDNDNVSNAFLKKIIRLATTKDLEREEQNRSREEKAMSIATKKIDNLKLNMTLIRVHYLFDHSRILFYFKAAGKVDFRNLVRELASVFKARIELRQIGVRDEAKMLGGIATCGRPLCCSSWLRAFAPVTVRMAKEQHLSLNPTKISGLCGRLQCCLEYEQNFYETTQKKLPSEGSMVNTSAGRGRLINVNILTEKAVILLADNSNVTVHIDELSGEKRHSCPSKGSCGGKCPSQEDSKNSSAEDSDKSSRQKNRPKRPDRPVSNNRIDKSPRKEKSDDLPRDEQSERSQGVEQSDKPQGMKQSDNLSVTEQTVNESDKSRNPRNNRFPQKKKSKNKNTPRPPRKTNIDSGNKTGQPLYTPAQNNIDSNSKSEDKETRDRNSETGRSKNRRNRNRTRGKNNLQTDLSSPSKSNKPKGTNNSQTPASNNNNKPSVNEKKISENG